MGRGGRPNLALERAAGGVVAGVDEAGCAPVAGPVVAAAVVLPRWRRVPRGLAELDDSKRLLPATRERLFDLILAQARFGIGAAGAREIDRLNILRADQLAMRRAVARLGLVPDLVLVDGNRPPRLSLPVAGVVGGDRRSLSIAAASVLAKVTRDRLMRRLARRYPGYGWERNVGYATEEHLMGLLRLGPTPHHRRSFHPVAALFGEGARDLLAAAGAGENWVALRRGLRVRLGADGRPLGLERLIEGAWRAAAFVSDAPGSECALR